MFACGMRCEGAESRRLSILVGAMSAYSLQDVLDGEKGRFSIAAERLGFVHPGLFAARRLASQPVLRPAAAGVTPASTSTRLVHVHWIQCLPISAIVVSH